MLELVKQNRPAPEDAMSSYYFYYVKGEAAADADFQTAAEIYDDAEYRHVLNALVIANANPVEVEANLGINSRVFDVYRTFFFDTTVFPHTMAKIRFVQELDAVEELRLHYEVAIQRGPDEIYKRYRVGKRPLLDATTVTQDAMTDMWDRFVTHRGGKITDEAVKEALKWGEAAVRSAKQIHEIKRLSETGSDGSNELRIALEVRETPSSPKETGVDLNTIVKD